MEEVLLLGSVPDDGLRSIDLSREPAADIEVQFAVRDRQALSSRVSRQVLARATLADANESRDSRIFADFRPCLDWDRPTALCQRPHRRRSGSESLRSGLNHHRSVPDIVSVGQISEAQGCRQNALAVGPSRQYPHFHSHFRWKTARCEMYSTTSRSRLLLRSK